MKKLGVLTKTVYGFGNLGYGTISQTLNSFIMFFGTSVLGISGSLVGFAVAISTLWDGVSDPIIGYLSDSSKNVFLGKRINYMFISSFAMAISNMLLWIIPITLPMWAKFVWFLLSLLMIETACTLFATPYFALGVDIAPDYCDQSSLQGFKTVFFIIGMIMPSILMMFFMPASGGDGQQFLQSGYINIAMATSILCLFTSLVSSLGTVKAFRQSPIVEIRRHKKEQFIKILKKFFTIMKSRNFSSVIIGYSIALLSSAFLISVGMHLFTYAYHFNTTQIPILMAVLLVSAILSQPVWVFLSNRTDKKSALKISMAVLLCGIGLTVITFMFRQFVENNLLFYLCVPCIFICGFGTGSLYSLPISMFADVLTLDKITTGQNNSATYSGFLTVSYNIANSIALLIIGVLLDLIKFDSTQPVQPLSVQNGLGAIVFVGCALAISISILFFSRYNLKRTDILKAQMNYEFISKEKKPIETENSQTEDKTEIKTENKTQNKAINKAEAQTKIEAKPEQITI